VCPSWTRSSQRLSIFSIIVNSVNYYPPSLLPATKIYILDILSAFRLNPTPNCHYAKNAPNCHYAKNAVPDCFLLLCMLYTVCQDRTNLLKTQTAPSSPPPLPHSNSRAHPPTSHIDPCTPRLPSNIRGELLVDLPHRADSNP
jgi:hypothetical protein